MTNITKSIFSKIIDREVPGEIFYEDQDLICIKDKNPKSKIHLLFIPKIEYRDYLDFCTTSDKVGEFFYIIARVLKEKGIKDFKLLTNNGMLSGQEIMHFHVHILSDQAI